MALIEAIDDAVVYKVNGEYRQGNGISAFYPYDGGEEMLNIYSQIYSAPLPQKCLYYHLIYGVMPQEGRNLLQGAAVQNISKPSRKEKIFNIEDLEDTKIKIDKNYNAYVKLSPAQMEILSNVHCNLAYVDVEDDIVLYLGSDSNVKANWDEGTFTDNFTGTWLMLNGNPVYVEVTADEDKYTLYSIPIKLNGVRCNLEVAYNFDSKEYEILGARRKLDGKRLADKNLIKLKVGDNITTLHYGMTIEGNDRDFTEVEVETFTLDENLAKVEEERLGDGEYLYCFEFVAPNGESATSQFVNFTIENNSIITNQLEE